ncbi:hypothetical protein [Shewanella japonica]|uniref:hypothetical protein n=1 Tax=Shewanella japonica TaxID=93973 RepID=UPI000E74ACA3|nr:hypothetical protein [Shewanella japonica]
MTIKIKRCFGKQALPKVTQGNNALRLQDWINLQAQTPLLFSDNQTESMARLLPLLLCGEQSAQLVFNQEIIRLHVQDLDKTLSTDISQRNGKIVTSLMEVESDECRHDIALQTVSDKLPYIEDTRQVQRLAKRFYSGLGRVNDYSQHFVRIAILDTCVTQIMQAFETSKLGGEHPFSVLCGLIKKDEAKHVYISRHHAIELGATNDDFYQQQSLITHELFQLLTSQHHSFENMGICLDAIQHKLEEKWQ